MGTHINVSRRVDFGLAEASSAALVCSRHPLRMTSPESVFAGRSYPVVTLRSWNISQSMLWTRLVRVIFVSARAIPMVRMKSPIWSF
ncbi:MAG: hypothetical protein JOZ16_06550 [Methylobacteriaceae bacterium]|nr:hypothetical protein [Methylobacteriaceae bacterium]MBV9841410.1 hypothetical protein [Sphingomonadaceae bacterium]